jgi:hypothetical protein
MSEPVKDTILHFYDDYLPALDAGDYTIYFNHNLSVAPQEFKSKQVFTVQGPQIDLPAGDVVSVFPPANATGEFGNDLAHIVFSKRVLPWERKLSKEVRNTPWMALLSFGENELLNGVNKETLSISVTAGSLSVQENGIVKPSFTLEADIDVKTMCNVIQVSGGVLKAILPNAREAGLLSHVRQVSMTGKEGLDEKDSGWFSVVIGNRFPADDSATGITRNLVHLVSLEGWEAQLNAPDSIDVAKTYQLISLHGWSFNCQSDKGQSFGALANNFVTGDENNPAFTALQLPLGVDTGRPAGEMASARLQRGFVPLAYRTRQAETTFSWYRGPLVPQPTTLFAGNGAFLSTSAATIFDPVMGIFDMSYAAAWQVGQSLALSDKTFAQTVFRFRKHGNQMVDLMVERKRQDSGVPVAKLLEGSPHVRRLTQFLQNKPHEALSAFAVNPDKQALAGRVQKLFKANDGRAVVADTAVPAHTAKTLMQEPSVPGTIAEELADELSYMGSWLADLHELRKVPFDHLVADTRMLPTESLRFFYVDNNWIELLVNGALSPGMHSTRDTAFVDMMKTSIRAAIDADLQKRWKAITGMELTPAPNTDVFDLPVSGILMRSAMVSGWPGLVVQAFQKGVMLKNIRMERLSPTVLLCLFLGVPDTIQVDEPQHSLRFGVDDNGNTELRQLKDPVGRPMSQSIKVRNTAKDTGADHMRKDAQGKDTRTINISSPDGKSGLEPDLLKPLGVSADQFGAAAMAIQLVQAPEQLIFKTPV